MVFVAPEKWRPTGDYMGEKSKSVEERDHGQPQREHENARFKPCQVELGSEIIWTAWVPRVASQAIFAVVRVFSRRMWFDSTHTERRVLAPTSLALTTASSYSACSGEVPPPCSFPFSLSSGSLLPAPTTSSMLAMAMAMFTITKSASTRNFRLRRHTVLSCGATST